MSFTATKSFAINCQNLLESKRFRHEHTHEKFAFDKEVNAVYFYSSGEINPEISKHKHKLSVLLLKGCKTN